MNLREDIDGKVAENIRKWRGGAGGGGGGATPL